MTNDPDDLIGRIAAIEPARGTPPLSGHSIRSLTRAATATPRAAPAWTWPKYRLASLGALVGSSALVVAAIVGLDAVGAPVPGVMTAVRTTSHPSLVPPTLAYIVHAEANSWYGTDTLLAKSMGACPVTLVTGSESAGLRHGSGHATAYRIESALSPSRAVLALAERLGLETSPLRWFPIGAHARGWWVGSLGGPSLITYSAKGITRWAYAARKESERRLLGDAGPHGANVPSAAASSRAAERVLAQLVPGVQLGRPLAVRSATDVEVDVALTVHGVATDERFDVEYLPGGRLGAASGPLTSVVGEVTYPTITPLSAARLLRQPKGDLVGLRGLSSAATTAPKHSGTPAPTLYCAATASVESVSDASMTLSANVLANGAVWLLPSWSFSTADDEVVPASLVAISPRYLLYEVPRIRYRGRGSR
jgi:hypothetical protein